MVMLKWSKLANITTISTNFNTKKIRNCRGVHDQIWFDHSDHGDFGILGTVLGQIWFDHFDHGTICPNGQKFVVIRPPPPKFLAVYST
jgi:hypothetical protein